MLSDGGGSIERVRAALVQAGHPDTIIQFPAGTRTAADAAAAVGCSVAQIAKSIVFRGKTYVGNYPLLPIVTVAVSGTQVVLKGDKDGETVQADFSRRPPRQLFVNGEVATFFR